MSKYVKCKTDNVKCSFVDFVEGTSARKYKINLIILYFARLLVPLHHTKDLDLFFFTFYN